MLNKSTRIQLVRFATFFLYNWVVYVKRNSYRIKYYTIENGKELRCRSMKNKMTSRWQFAKIDCNDLSISSMEYIRYEFKPNSIAISSQIMKFKLYEKKERKKNSKLNIVWFLTNFRRNLRNRKIFIEWFKLYWARVYVL